MDVETIKHVKLVASDGPLDDPVDVRVVLPSALIQNLLPEDRESRRIIVVSLHGPQDPFSVTSE